MFNFSKKSNEPCTQPEFLEKLAKLRARETDLLSAIALQHFDKGIQNITAAYENKDIQVDNMFEANVLAMQSLKPAQRFLGISAIIDPDHWAYDTYLQEYKRLNYAQAKKGVHVERIFILHNQKEVDQMASVMNEQIANGVHVRYVMEDSIKHVSSFPDFTILPDIDCAIYVPNLSKLLQCFVTNNKKIIQEIQRDFNHIKLESKPWEKR
jgi:hypothetical protein